MARSLRAAPVMLLPFMLVGCTEWVHPTKSPDQFAYDEASCEQQAIDKVHFVAQKEDAPKWMKRAIGTPTVTTDGNEDSRKRWRDACLRMGGWALRSAASRPGVDKTDLLGPAYRYVAR